MDKLQDITRKYLQMLQEKKVFYQKRQIIRTVWANLTLFCEAFFRRKGEWLLIQMNGVSKVYSNGSVALSDINVQIDKGEFVFVVGPSGAGKSTFIKLVFREELPTQGDLVVNGRNVGDLEPQEVPYLRRGLGIVFQDYRLLPNRTAYENVAFAMQVVESSHREIQKRVPHVLDLVGLRQKARHYPTQMSGGEQQRIAIARAIVNNPVIVIADEPTGNLDPETSWEIMKIFDRINQNGTTIVMATHDKTVVDGMRKRVIAIEKSRIVRDEAKGVYGYED